MKWWMIGGVATACVSLSVYLLMTKPDAPQMPEPDDLPITTTAAAPLKIPVVLAEVVDVTDLDPLLDPPVRPVAGIPFDIDPPVVPVTTPGVPDRIPLAVD
jgi:hypothetical protein